EEAATGPCYPSTYHTFDKAADVIQIRSQLLSWYDQEKRELPWRTVALKETDLNIRTYAVWVSEIMLQQTQVATVIDYYNKWMKEVNKMWAGLGYYSRGKRLHEGAQKVVTELKGEMPRTTESLLKQLPGVSGVVDGNVIRVLCRLRAIGADSTSPAVTEALWGLANTLVDPERPGDFNQAMMELGAQVCTPKAALCGRCPLQAHCHSYHKKLLGKVGKTPSTPVDIEECTSPASCTLCPAEPWQDDLGVHNFPRKPAKKAPRVEHTLTCVVLRPGGRSGEDEYLLTQRPNKGLLAGMWEFPSMLSEGESPDIQRRGALCTEVGRILGVKLHRDRLRYVGEVVHIFSHIHQTYIVYSVRLKDDERVTGETQSENAQWLSRSAVLEAAVSTGMKKDGKRKKAVVVKNGKSSMSKKTKPNTANGTRQLSLNSFFKTSEEK
ncbi:hypothetical protein CRUP_020378, partial [Coryphaenoides rupestris]